MRVVNDFLLIYGNGRTVFAPNIVDAPGAQRTDKE